MLNSKNILFFMTALVWLALASCSKTDTVVARTYGTLSYQGRGITLTTSDTLNQGGYSLTCTGRDDQNRLSQCVFLAPERPVTAKQIAFGPNTKLIVLVESDSLKTVVGHYYESPTEGVLADQQDNRVKISFTNLTEKTTTSTGIPVSGTMSE